MGSIIAEQVDYSYRRWFGARGRPALRGFSLRAEPGRVYGLVGANGAGKSTFLRIAAGMLAARRGSVSVLGLPPGHGECADRVCFLPEHQELPSRITVLEAMNLQAALYGLPRVERHARVHQALEQLGMAEHRSRRISALSKGQRRRVDLARVLLPRPMVFLLDEPLDGVDPIWCETIRGIFQELAREGATVLFSSHHLLDVENVCDWIVVLENGEVVRDGPLEDVLARKEEWVIHVEGPLARAPDRERIAEALGMPDGSHVHLRHPWRSLAELLKSVRGRR